MKSGKRFLNIIVILLGILVFSLLIIENPTAEMLQASIFHWAELLFAVLLFVSIIHFILSCIRSPMDGIASSVNHILAFASFLGVLVLGFLDGFESPQLLQTVLTVQTAVETSLAALISIGLIFALYRLPLHRITPMKGAFLAGMIVFLVIYSGILNYFTENSVVSVIIQLLKAIPLGVIYGLLIGLAIGGLVMGIGFIFFGKNPYRGQK